MAYQGSITLVDLSDGQSGTPGINTAVIYLYQRAITIPDGPNGILRYNFENHTISGDYFNNWTQFIDDLSGDNPIWIIAATATASADIGYDDILAAEWSTPIKMAQDGQDGPDGAPGTNGINTATVYIYKRSDSTPSTPADTTYTFADGSFTVPTGWNGQVPTSNGNPCYVCSAIAISNESTATLEWSTPVILVEDGEQGVQGASVVAERELYYLKTNSSAVPQITDSSQITSTNRQNGWTSIVPTYVSNGNYYTCIETTLDDDDTTIILWSTPILNQGLTNANANAASALTQAGEASAATALLGGHFIYRVDTTPGTLTPSSANIVQTIKNIHNVDVTDDPTQWEYNTHIGANGIKLRHNETDLSSWTNSSLIFYDPSRGAKMMELSSSALKFFDVNDSTHPLMSLSGQALNFYQYGTNTAAATLDSNGLSIVSGSIQLGDQNSLTPTANKKGFYVNSVGAVYIGNNTNYIRFYPSSGTTPNQIQIQGGTVNSNGFVFLSTTDYGTALTIGNGTNKTDWRLIIGSKFGIDDEGNLYASSVDLTGKITATSGAIGGFTIDANSMSNGTYGTSNSVLVCTGTEDSKSIGGSDTINGWCFTAGADFGVTKTGALYANSANITGTITATSFTAKNGSATTATFGSSIALGSNGATVTIGQVAANKYNAYITTSNFQIRKNTTAIATFGSSISLGSDGATVTIGKTSNNHIIIDTSSLQMKTNRTTIATFKAQNTTIAAHADTWTTVQSDGSIGFFAGGRSIDDSNGPSFSIVRDLDDDTQYFRFNKSTVPYPMIVASSTNANISLSNSTITKVPMDTRKFYGLESGSNTIFQITSGNIKQIYLDGCYIRVSGSVYVTTSSEALVNVFVYRVNNLGTKYEVAAGNAIINNYGVVQLTPRLSSYVSYQDDYYYLAVRVMGTTGTAVCNHKDTQLCIELLGWA